MDFLSVLLRMPYLVVTAQRGSSTEMIKSDFHISVQLNTT